MSVAAQSKINKRIKKLTVVSERICSNNYTFHIEARTLGKIVLLILDPPEFSLPIPHIETKKAPLPVLKTLGTAHKKYTF